MRHFMCLLNCSQNKRSHLLNSLILELSCLNGVIMKEDCQFPCVTGNCTSIKKNWLYYFRNRLLFSVCPFYEKQLRTRRCCPSSTINYHQYLVIISNSFYNIAKLKVHNKQLIKHGTVTLYIFDKRLEDCMQYT